MKKFIYIFAVIALLIGASKLVYPRIAELSSLSPQKVVKKENHPSNMSSKVVSFIPKRLLISKLGIDTVVESVGMDNEGRMDVPKDADNVAWYNLGFKPGQTGSAVIAAHFDKPDGSPAVFANLTNLRAGDTIEVENTEGQKLTYKVTTTSSYPYDSFPLQKVFNTTTTKGLNLITCDGTWNKSKKSYTNRFVVYSVLK